MGLVLLAEAMVAVALSRNWHLSWWEWHLLMLAAFVAIALGARREYTRVGSLAGAFGGLYLEQTLASIDRWHAGAIARVMDADERGTSEDIVLARLRREGASTDEVRLIAHAAGELRRLDAAFRPYLPSIIADHVPDEPSMARLGGTEREVSVLFADLSAFTTFSERHAATEVIAMLNDYWAAVVPGIDAAGGEIEQFVGDAVMAAFNVEGDQPDHAQRATRAALAIIDAGRGVLATHPDWPAFRVGVSTGTAVVGNVGTRGRRSFAVIGDTTNTAARLMSVASPGEVLVTGVHLAPPRRAVAGRDAGAGRHQGPPPAGGDLAGQPRAAHRLRRLRRHGGRVRSAMRGWRAPGAWSAVNAAPKPHPGSGSVAGAARP